MEDNRHSNSSNGRRGRTTLVLLLAVGTLTVAGVAGTVLLGRGDAAAGHPALSGPQTQATGPAGAGNPQSTGAGTNSGQQLDGQGKSPDPQQADNPGNPGKPGKLPPVNQVPTRPITPPAAALPKPTIPPGAGIRHP